MVMDPHCFYLYTVEAGEHWPEWFCIEVVLTNGNHASLDRYQVGDDMIDATLSNRLFFYTEAARAKFITWAVSAFEIEVVDISWALT